MSFARIRRLLDFAEAAGQAVGFLLFSLGPWEQGATSSRVFVLYL
jgi:hypothetical protein